MKLSKLKISMPIEVPSLSDDVDFQPLRKNINLYVEKLSERLNLNDIDEEWKIFISICSRCTDSIGVYKRGTRYPSDKEVQLSISIPIPDLKSAKYGSSKVSRGFFTAIDPKKFYVLSPDFEKYDNLSDFIVESAKRAINEAFTHGFTVNGKKIKFQD
jgi:hypothetical protein